MSIMVRNEDKDKINSFPYTPRTHLTLKDERFISFYAGDLHFLVSCAGWLVTHIYELYIFEKAIFKKNFVVMNQKTRQIGILDIGYSNYILETLYYEFIQISYIKKFTTIFNDDTLSHFFSPTLLRGEIIQPFQSEMFAKKLCYYEIENIDNPCIITLAVNPKEYLEMLKNLILNKKYKGIKKGSTGLGFENFVEKIKPLVKFETFKKLPVDQKQVSRFSR